MVEYLDPAIAGEGQAVDENGNTIGEWVVPAQATIPNYDGLRKSKKFGKYFQPYGTPSRPHQVFPAWLYHPKHEAVIVRNAGEALAKYGCSYRDTTREEQIRGFPPKVWDYSTQTAEQSGWRAVPYADKPHIDDSCKNVVVEPSKGPSQGELISSVVAAVVAQMQAKAAAGTNALAAANPADDPRYAEFLEFQKWKAAKSAEPSREPQPSLLHPDEEKRMLKEAAASRGIELDGRWSVERMKQELDKYEDAS